MGGMTLRGAGASACQPFWVGRLGKRIEKRRRSSIRSEEIRARRRQTSRAGGKNQSERPAIQAGIRSFPMGMLGECGSSKSYVPQTAMPALILVLVLMVFLLPTCSTDD